VTFSLNGNHFISDGTRTLSEGWQRFYKPYSPLKDVSPPLVVEGQKIAVKGIILKDNLTKPPARYNPRSLLLKMEKEEVGTKSTRAAIIQTLYDRKYLIGKDSIGISELGLKVIEILTKYCPTVVSPELTRMLEEEMDEIREGRKTKDTVLQNAVAVLKPVLAELKANEQAIGAQLSQALKNVRLKEKTVGTCPKCADGKLVILRSRKTGKRFVGCTNHFNGNCNATFPLPQNGKIKPLNALCKNCGCPVISVLINGKRFWKFCLNPDCPSKGATRG